MSAWERRSAGAPACLHACALALLFALVGCSGGAEEPIAEVEPDSVLAEALVPLYLADARAAVTGEDAGRLRDAAYAEARRTTGLDSAAVGARLRDAVRRPDEAAALYRRVAERLEALRR